MKATVRLIAGIALVAGALVAGYWWGSAKAPVPAMDPPETPVSEGKDKGKGKAKILYYRNPMGHPDTSPMPKKDSMGMDYLPVYEDEAHSSDGSVVKISTEKIQKLGVRTEVAALRELTGTVRAVATVQADERRLYTVAPRFEGWIQRLYVNTSGQAVRKGEPLMEVYSPELITAQHEYLIARKGMQSVEGSGPEVLAGMQRLAENALQRLHNWDISETELQALQQEGKIRQHLVLRATVSGVVVEKHAIQGQRFTPGEVLYQIADLSRVWMLADVFEQDLVHVHPGQSAAIRIDAYRDKVFDGKVTFVYPTVASETRTAKVRIELPNSQGLLKPDMYGQVEFTSFHGKGKVLAVPDSAVLDTGTRRLVLVDLGGGRFEPRTVKLGVRADGYAEVLEGLTAGETVVVSANFLIDAESNLKAALSGFGHPPSGSARAEKGQAMSGASMTAAATPAPASHHGTGEIKKMDWAHATVTIAHDPIASLDWPAMTMDFHAQDPAWLQALKPGQKVGFEIIQASAGEYVIVRIRPLGTSPAADPRRGH